MARIFHDYTKPFILDEPKINRIKNIIDEKFADLKLPAIYKFDVFTKGQKSYVFDNIDDLASLDNSRKERVKDLFLTCTDSSENKKDDKEANNRIEVHFHSKEQAKICLKIKSDNARWANDLNSLIDEQIERTIQNELMYKIAYQKWGILILTILLVVVGSMIIKWIGAGSDGGIKLESSDIDRIENILRDSTHSVTEKAAHIIVVHSESFIKQQKAPTQSFLYSAFTDLNYLLIITPLLIIAISFIYVTFFCYPNAVFLWGDAKEWFRKLVSRRKAIWSLIIFSMVIGILSNLFVVGLSKFLK